jgi:hypothetical protein
MAKASALRQAQYHAWFHHNDADGWITVAKKEPGRGFLQTHYRPEELAEALTQWIGEDVFFSQNTFFKTRRSIETIRQLRSLYVDLDFYLFNYEPSWVLGKLEQEYYGQSVPEPNLIIFSGQGVVLIWLLDPVPYKALPLWQAVQNYFIDQLKDLGGDPKAADAARVFRIAGSINSKNGSEVQAEYRHNQRYELRQIQFDYLPDLTDVIKANKRSKPGRKKKVVHLFNIYKLHFTRLQDLVKLVELRDYDIHGYRELVCFLYRYWKCCYSNDPEQSLNEVMLFNLEFREPLTLQEVERATKSAEKAWEAKNNVEANRIAIEKGYPGAGYNISNKKLIQWLDITSDEMAHLKTIIDTKEKNCRKRIANTKRRREEGVKPREQYIKEQHDKTDANLVKLRTLLEDQPNLKKTELASVLGVSRVHLYRLLKQV